MQLKGASPCLVERSVRLQFVSKRPTVRRSWWGPSPNYPALMYNGCQKLSGWSRMRSRPNGSSSSSSRAGGAAGGREPTCEPVMDWSSDVLCCAVLCGAVRGRTVPCNSEGNNRWSLPSLLSCPRNWKPRKHCRVDEGLRMAWSPQLVLLSQDQLW